VSLALRQAREKVGTAPPWLFVAFLAAAAVGSVTLKYGVAWHPEWTRLHDAAAHWPAIADAPLIQEGDRSLLSNISLSWIAGALGATSIPAYFLLCWLAAMLAMALPFAMRWRSPAFARLAFVAVAGGAVAPVLLAWVGGYDAIVVIAASIAVLSRRAWAAAAGWALLGFSHSAVAVAALLLWTPVMWSAARDYPNGRVARLATAGASAGAGWLAIHALTDAWGGSTDRFALFRAIDPGAIAASYLSAAPLVVFGALGIVWILLADDRIWPLRSTRALLAVALVGSVVLPLVAVDQTRIVALSLFAATLAWIDDLAPRLGLEPGQEHNRRWRTWALSAAIVPIPVVWMGTVLYPGWGTLDDWATLLGG
jgi:hypothetical protein